MIPSIHEPPFVSAELPALGGAIGSEPEDFEVEEIPAYAASGAGEHWYVMLEKRRLSTPELVRRVADLAGVDARDVGYAGLKDKHAVTRQWLSLPGNAPDPTSWSLPPEVRLLAVSRHNNKLRTGHLTGNRFSITLTGVAEGARANAEAIVERVSAFGLPNYFGAQRFGRDGDNLARAVAWLRGGARARLSPFLLKLYPSVVQAELFNRYVTRRLAEARDVLLAGEVVRISASYASFVVEDVEREAPRFLSREIVPTGPMLGPKMRPAQGRPLELENEVCDELDVDAAFRQVLGKFAPGARRDVWVHPEALSMSAGEGGRLTLKFVLPAGSYATVLVRELTRTPFLGADVERERE